jgi:flagellar protein FlgJ
MDSRDFVNKYYPFAKETEEKTGISALFTLAQSALETGWGEKAPGNMFFGVKANPNTCPEDKRQLVVTSEVLKDNLQSGKFPIVLSITPRADGKFLYRVKDWFRKYDSPEESFTDHAQFFLSNKRYVDALTVRDDPYKFADAVAKAGYATDPNYAWSLRSVIKTVENCLIKK